MEIATGSLTRDEYVHAIGLIVEFLQLHDLNNILVAFGFGCDCPDEQLYRDVEMPLNQLQPFITESEACEYYCMGKDNLHVKDLKGRWEFLFCHEADIHFVTEDEGLFGKVRAIWIANGYKDIYEKRTADWQRVIT